MADAPVILVPCLMKREPPERSSLPDIVQARYAAHLANQQRISGSSIYPAIQNIILACRALGLGTVITTNHILYEDEVKAVLGMPDNAATFALMPMGYPTGKYGPLTRKPAAEVTYADSWGSWRVTRRPWRRFGGFMALLLIDLDKRIGSAEAWRDTFKQQLPDLEVRNWPDAGDLKDIEYLAFMHPDFGRLPAFPNLKAMFSRAAGVEFVGHPKLPKVPLGKVEPPGGDPMMTEYVVMHVLRFHRDMPGYQAAQAGGNGAGCRSFGPEERRVGFLGFGMMAKAPALVLKSLGFPVSAWVRSPRQSAEVPIFHGRDQLEAFLDQTDIAVCLLPLTRETEGIFCARTFAMMPRGAMLVNVGRGKHVVDMDLIGALDLGQLSYAALDALWPEPLPPESPLWLHPKVTVMPHIARRPTVAQLVTQMVANNRHSHGNSMPPFRSFLFAPGNHARKVMKVFGCGADHVILDLEDAVAKAEKVATRALVVEALHQPRGCGAYIRVNAYNTEFCYGDAVAVVGRRLDGIILPMVESRGQSWPSTGWSAPSSASAACRPAASTSSRSSRRAKASPRPGRSRPPAPG